MEHIKVKSSNIESVAHDGTTLHVQYRHGGLYEFEGVSKDDFNELLNADSIGKHLNSMNLLGLRIDKESGR